MSRYTTQLRFICETLAGNSESEGETNIETIISKARPKIFDFDYLYYNDEQKARWERHFLMYYYLDEICEETFGLWKHRLKTRLDHLMNKYYRLYEVSDKTFHLNPLETVNYTRTNSGSNTENNSGSTATSSQSSSDSWSMYSDTPQGSLNGISDNRYLTNARHDTNTYNDSGSANTSGNKTGTTEFEETIKGTMPTKTYSELLKEYQNAVYNIDAQLTEEMKDLFMMLW